MHEDIIKQMALEMRRHFAAVVLPFWKGLKDDIYGGYIGVVTQDLKRDINADKGCILNSRILWFFSQASMTLMDNSLLQYADHAYRMLCCMTDVQNGGVYWSIHADGTPADTTKHTYNQAFAIYAMSTYAEASGNRSVLEKALALFDMIEAKCSDRQGYLEAFTKDFRPASNEKLSENGVMAERTMNTVLHILEAYTELYRVSRAAKVRKRLIDILNIWEQHIYNREKHRQEVFFDRNYHSLIDLHSYGHDIETSWLADRTLEILDDAALTQSIRPHLMELVEQVYQDALTDHGFVNERDGDKVDTTRVWWIQSETVVGFLNAWEKTGEKRYLLAAQRQWKYIQKAMVDKRHGSEWFWSVDENDVPIAEKPIVEPWKCPYHNGRMLFEVIRRSANEELS